MFLGKSYYDDEYEYRVVSIHEQCIRTFTQLVKDLQNLRNLTPESLKEIGLDKDGWALGGCFINVLSFFIKRKRQLPLIASSVTVKK